jgi:hypothetical protein
MAPKRAAGRRQALDVRVPILVPILFFHQKNCKLLHLKDEIYIFSILLQEKNTFKYLYISKNHRIMYGALINNQKVEGCFLFVNFCILLGCLMYDTI